MRDRLINDLDSADLFLRNRANSSPAPLNEYDIEEMLDIAKICDEAARTLEKAIIPPVGVGQKVYVISEVSRNITECEVIGVWQCKYNYSFITDIGVIHTNSLGKTVFLTREEAEQKLKEGKG